MPRLTKVRPGTDLGYRRVRAGSGFRYTDADGAALPADERDRVVSLAIPPAWTDVWISAAPNGHIQATGVDEAGRVQYLYHPEWSVGRARRLRFPGKSGKRQSLEIDDEDLAAVVALLADGRPSSSLLSYERGRRRVPLTPKDVNAYVRTMTGGVFTAKDFRTLRGTIAAADALARIGAPDTAADRRRAEVLATKAAAGALGNTPAVAKGSYIDPRVFARYRRGRLLDTTVSPESAIRALILG